jgi:hypothetical protein
MSHVLDVQGCANCSAPLHGAYCAHCGQKVAAIDPTVRRVVGELWDEVVPVDGKIIRSLRLLLTQFGFLTRELLRGRRASYVAPFRLYLVFSVAAFAVIALMPRREPELTPQDVKEMQEDAQQRQAEREARREPALRRGWSVNASGPNFRLDGMSLEGRRALGAEIMRLLPRAMFMMVPVFALMVGGVARKAGRNYPTHLYFALHVHAAYFALLALTTPLELLTRWAGVIGSLGRPLYALIYLAIAFRRVYEYGRISSAIRAAVVFFTYLFLVVIAFLFTAVVAAYLSGAVRGGR